MCFLLFHSISAFLFLSSPSTNTKRFVCINMLLLWLHKYSVNIYHLYSWIDFSVCCFGCLLFSWRACVSSVHFVVRPNGKKNHHNVFIITVFFIVAFTINFYITSSDCNHWSKLKKKSKTGEHKTLFFRVRLLDHVLYNFNVLFLSIFSFSFIHFDEWACIFSIFTLLCKESCIEFKW